MNQIRTWTIVVLLMPISLLSRAQISFFGGVNVGQNFFYESPQENYATKFNLGWDISFTADNRLLFFQPSTTNYTPTNAFVWDKSTRGLIGGIQVGKGKLKHEFYFQGRTNLGKGERTNGSTGGKETFKMSSKYGGLFYALSYQLKPRFSIFYSFGFHRYKLKYSWQSDAFSVDKTVVGYQTKIVGNPKPGSKAISFSNAFGVSFALIDQPKFSFELRPEIRMAFNKMVKVSRGVAYQNFLYNVNQVNVSAIIHLKSTEE